jgi:hypothetical protein
MTENNLTYIESTILPFINSSVTLVQKENHENLPVSYEISDFDVKLKKIEDFQNMVSKYVYKEEDRQAIKKLKSTTKKLIDDIKRDIKAQRQLMFKDADEQQVRLERALNKLQSTLALGLDQDDKRVKAKNKTELIELFNVAKSSYTFIKDTEFSFEDIFVSSWVNRSASLNKTIAEMNRRISSVDSLLGSPMCPVNDLDQIIEALSDSDWDGLVAQNLLIEQENKRQEEELARLMLEQAKKEKELLEQSNLKSVDTANVTSAEQVLPSKLIKINGADWNRAKALLTAAKIRFEEA